jgi:hypothetical protein
MNCSKTVSGSTFDSFSKKSFLRNWTLRAAVFAGLAFLSPILSFATPTPPSPDLTTENAPDIPATSEEIDRAKQIEITTPPPVRLRTDRSRNYFYHYRQALSFHGGLSSNIESFNSASSTMGFQYRFSLTQGNRVEVGADLLTSGTGLIHASRFHFLDDDRFRFFYKYGLEVRVIPSEELVTFLKLVNWRARLASGFEWNTWDSIGLRLDLEAHIGTSDRTLVAIAGLAYSF